MEVSDEVQLQADCRPNRSDVHWIVEKPPISAGGEIIIEYQCSVSCYTVACKKASVSVNPISCELSYASEHLSVKRCLLT